MNALQKNLIQNRKEEIKNLAKEIRELKSKMRTSGHQVTWKEQRDLENLKYSFRYKHVASSIMRGTPYGKIEKPRKGNEIYYDQVQAHIDEFKETFEACADTDTIKVTEVSKDTVDAV